MDINQLLKGVDCGCGRHHTCDIQYVYIERGAIGRLAEICAGFTRVLIVSDENTFAAAGAQTEAALAGKTVNKVTFPGSEILVPDEKAVAGVEAKLDGTQLLVGIGSGVIQDLCKFVSFRHKIPYVVVATAPSMDGYASNGAAMIMGGMKVTYPAGLPMAILADTQVLKNAPMEMIKAGYGDIIGKFSALNDWKLSRCVNGEYFCDFIYDLTMEQVQQTLKLADGVLQRSEESIATLMEALVVIGILMSFAGSSRPASGSEHHLSHFFEITGIVHGQPYLPHGIDVAYSTVVTAALREKLLAAQWPKVSRRASRAGYEKKMTEIYGSVGESCVALQDKVGNYARDRSEIYLEKEEELRSILAEMPTAEEIRRMLALADLHDEELYRVYGERKVENAVLYAKDLKDRYTALWISYDFFGGDEDNA